MEKREVSNFRYSLFSTDCFFLFRLSGRDSNIFFKIHGFSIDKFVGWIEVELKAPARPRLHVLHPVFTSLKTGGRSTYVKGPTNLANVMTSNDLHLPQPISALAGTTLRPARDALFVPAGWEALRREPGEGRLSVHLITSSCLCLCVCVGLHSHHLLLDFWTHVSHEWECHF